MPEGDTLHRLAATLQDLVGRSVSRVSLRERGDVEELAGLMLESIEARGKHLLLRLQGGYHLRVHLGMRGRMRRLPQGSATRHRFAPLLLCAGTDTIAFTHPSRVELYRGRPEHSRQIAQLGPDLLADSLDLDLVVRRARAQGDRALGELLLDQRVACGVGNVYKSEALFSCGLSPFARVREVDDDALRSLYAALRSSMQHNLGPGPRVTVSRAGVRSADPRRNPRHAVYRRAGLPCPSCQTPLEMTRQGDAARSTYYCPSCQSAALAPRGKRST